MSWREFQLKRYGFIRQQKEQMNHTRTIAYMIYLSIPEGKKKKLTIDQWWSLESKKGVKDWQKKMLLDAQKLAVEEAKQKKIKNGR